jgi:tetratricopeptide (TPR) repeat protein
VLGHVDEARNALETLASNRFASLPFDEEWLVSMALLAETARTLGDADHAPVLYELLLQYDGRVAVSYPEISIGVVSRYLGMLAETMCRWDDAGRHYEAAIAMSERIGAPSWLAHARADLGVLLIEHGRPGDTERAQVLLSQALTTYRELGMQTHAARASAFTRHA